MGDRGNVAMIQDDEKSVVYLYTHWGGTELAHTVQLALKKKWRWSDSPYLTRIIFEEMVPKQYHGAETGFGISTVICDNEYPIVVVNPAKQTVGFANEETPTQPYTEWSFEDYIALDGDVLQQRWEEC